MVHALKDEADSGLVPIAIKIQQLQKNLLLDEHKDVAGAESAYRDAIAADPKFVEAHNNLEYLLNNMKTFN